MSLRYLSVFDVLILLALSVGSPAISAAIAYAAWTGKPAGFDREKFGISFVTAVAAALFFFVYSQRMQADVRTPLFLLQLAIFALGVVFFGIAGGCLLGIFIYRRGQRSAK